MRPELLIEGLYLAGPNDTVFFTREDDKLDLRMTDKLDKFLATAPAGIRFHGYVSDDEHTGQDDARTDLGLRRAQRVADYLRSKNWNGLVELKSGVSTAPVIDSTRMRKAVMKPLEPQNTPMEEGELDPHQPAPPAFETARLEALRQTTLAAAGLNQLLPQATQAARILFGAEANVGVLGSKVDSMRYVLDRMRELKPTDLVVSDDDTPEQLIPRYRYLTRGGPSLAMTSKLGDHALMTFGPDMVDDSPEEQAITFIHESAHAATSIKAEDRAYAKDRLFKHLPQAKKDENADHYRLLVGAIAAGQVPNIPEKDTYQDGMTAEQVHAAGGGIAYAEVYLTFARQEVERVHRYAWHAVYENKEWRTAYNDTLRDIREWFGTDLSDGSKNGVFTKEDVNVFAGIHDRLDVLVDLAKKKLKVSLAVDTEFDSASNRLTVNDTYFEKSAEWQARRIVFAYVEGCEYVDKVDSKKYVELAEDIAESQGNHR
jgi:hypothetical protein